MSDPRNIPQVTVSVHAADATAQLLLDERARHNNRVAVRVCLLAFAGGLIMLLQHIIMPTAAAGPGTPLWTVYALVYGVGTTVAAVLALMGLRAKRWSTRASQAFSLTTATIFGVALTALSIVASGTVSNMGAVVLGVFVVAGAYRSERRFAFTFVLGALVAFAVGRLLAWGRIDAVTVVLSVVVAAFGIYIAASMEATRVEAFRARDELDRQNRVLAELSATDPLTGVFNRRTAEHHLVIHLDEFRRYGARCTVILVDVDHFKQVNDGHGHGIGDEVLIDLARILGSSLRTSDQLARIGGEEFLLILPHTDEAGALRLAERLRLSLESTALSSRHLFVTASFGVAETGPEDEDPRSLLDRADKALYQAKSRGRNRVCCPHLVNEAESVAGD